MRTKATLGIGLISIWFLTVKPVAGQQKPDLYFEHLFSNKKFMGSVAMSFNDSIIYAKSVGYADADRQIPITGDTRFRIGSVTKTFTAVLVLQAVEAKKLTLDNKLDIYYPGIKNAGNITIEQLLKQRSGIFNFTEIPGERVWEEQYHTQKEILDYVSGLDSNFDPGTDYAYSNTNYALLGFILEQVYGLPFADILDQQICRPLGLKNTYYSFETDTSRQEALSYNIQDRYLKNGKVNFSNHPASGGMVSTPVDVNIFLTGLFNNKLIGEQSLEKMLPVNKGEYGMGIEKLSFNNPEGYEHTGRIENYISDYWYFPKEKLGIVTLANAINISIEDINTVLLQYAYGNRPALPDFNQTMNLPDTVFMQLKGTYDEQDGSASVTISSDGQYLVFQKSTPGQDYLLFEYKEANVFSYKNITLRFFPEKRELRLEQNGIKETYIKK